MAKDKAHPEPDWQVQKICADIQDYELIVEKQKNNWSCEQMLESWKWIISYHGSVVASGSINSMEEAKALAIANIPETGKSDK